MLFLQSAHSDKALSEALHASVAEVSNVFTESTGHNAYSDKKTRFLNPHIISNLVASELILPARKRQCRFPTINRGRDTALPIGVNLSLKALINLVFL